MITQRIKEIVQGFATQQVVVVGDVCIDHYITGVVERLNPEAPVPILHAKQEHIATGCAGNVAKNAAMLGATSHLISVVGSDDSASVLADQVKKEGYTCDFVTDSSRPTSRKTRYIVGSQQLLRVDFEETHPVTEEVEKKIISQVRAAVEQGAGAIIVSDYAKGTVTQKLAESLLALASEHNILIAVDTKAAHARFFTGASLMTPNLKEAHEFLGISYLGDRHKAEDIGERVSREFKTDAYITLGAEGIYVCPQGKKGVRFAQEHVVEVFDVSGAGDTALVTIVLSLLSGATPQEAGQLVNAAGAVVVGKVGSVGVTQTEILHMATHHHE